MARDHVERAAEIVLVVVLTTPPPSAALTIPSSPIIATSLPSTTLINMIHRPSAAQVHNDPPLARSPGGGTASAVDPAVPGLALAAVRATGALGEVEVGDCVGVGVGGGGVEDGEESEEGEDDWGWEVHWFGWDCGC